MTIACLSLLVLLVQFQPTPAPVPRCSPLYIINKLAEHTNILSDSNPYFPVEPCEYGGPLNAIKAGDLKSVFIFAQPQNVLLHNFYELIWLLKTGGPRIMRIMNGQEKFIRDDNILNEGYQHYTPYVRTKQLGQNTYRNPAIIDNIKLYKNVVGKKIRWLKKEGADTYINKDYTFQGNLKGKGQGGYGAPSAGYGAPSAGYGAPSAGYGAPSAGYGAPSAGYGAPSSSGYSSSGSGHGGGGANTKSSFSFPNDGTSSGNEGTSSGFSSFDGTLESDNKYNNDFVDDTGDFSSSGGSYSSNSVGSPAVSAQQPGYTTSTSSTTNSGGHQYTSSVFDSGNNANVVQYVSNNNNNNNNPFLREKKSAHQQQQLLPTLNQRAEVGFKLVEDPHFLPSTGPAEGGLKRDSATTTGITTFGSSFESRTSSPYFLSQRSSSGAKEKKGS